VGLYLLTIVVLLVTMAAPGTGSAQALGDYTASPPFLSIGTDSNDPTDTFGGSSGDACRVQKPQSAQSAAALQTMNKYVQGLESGEATNQYKQRLLGTLTGITQRPASATSPSVLAAPSGEGALYHAFFYPVLYEGTRGVKWVGYTQSLFVDPFNNLREDTDGDGRLVLEQDQIIRTRFDRASRGLLIERFQDTDGNGIVDTQLPFQTVSFGNLKSVWEAGKRLARTEPDDRRLLTWVDLDQDGLVAPSEQIEFSAGNETTLSPFLRAKGAPLTAGNIIKFIRGEQVPGLRDRELTVADEAGTESRIWKLGDPMHSSPVVVGAPKERYDVLYGDRGYAAFFQRYRHRRHVVYIGANDGMLHAFNAGFYHRGDDRSTKPIEHGWFTRNPDNNETGPQFGQELWGFIPYQLLPQLQWLARSDYAHAYYVDLKPKVTDVRIFEPDEDHPNGWGTILIGGFRMGGSCGACQSGSGAAPMTVKADFGSGAQSRTFYTAYFVLDITNPDRDPVLLWSFSDPSLGLSTSYPTVLRVSPTGPLKDQASAEKWFMMVGSGPTTYDGNSAQPGILFAIDLKTGPTDPAGSSTVQVFPTNDAKSFLGDVTGVDTNLDFRVDALYVGSSIHHGDEPVWTGKLYRLTTGGRPDPRTWGITDGADQIPTVLLATLPPRITAQDLLAADLLDPSEIPATYGFVGDDLQALGIEIHEDSVGPITAAPIVSTDDQGKLWVFTGTGRFYGNSDKTNTDSQYLLGIKDPVLTEGCMQLNASNCESRNLLNVSDASICWRCPVAQRVGGVPGIGSYDALLTKIRTMDGWYLSLSSPRERSVTRPALVGGLLYFSSFIPNNTLCSDSGHGYVLYYASGTAFKEPLTGPEPDGNGNVPRKISLGQGGMVSSLSVHLAHEVRSDRRGIRASCQSWTAGFLQSSFGPLAEICAKPALPTGSRIISWLKARN
jgi:type IV pilus assembly protein PilY1